MHLVNVVSIKVVVALRKESVDRNCDVQLLFLIVQLSLSARRAWIEILMTLAQAAAAKASLSARRAWIEMDMSDNANKMGTSRSPQGERG